MKTSNSEVLCDYCGKPIQVMLEDNSATNPHSVYVRLQFGSGERERGDFCNIGCFGAWVDRLEHEEINKALGVPS